MVSETWFILLPSNYIFTFPASFLYPWLLREAHSKWPAVIQDHLWSGEHHSIFFWRCSGLASIFSSAFSFVASLMSFWKAIGKEWLRQPTVTVKGCRRQNAVPTPARQGWCCRTQGVCEARINTRVIQLADRLAFLECELNLVTDGRPFA